MSEIVIIGGAGKTGRRVGDRLADKGIPVRFASRSTPAVFDWAQPETWRGAIEGSASAYVTYQPDVAMPGADQAIAGLCRVAQACGLEHLVLLSGRGEPGALRAEEALVHSGLPYTIVRASWFAQNFSEGFLVDGVLAGAIALPADRVTEPFVDADDIADVVVAALTEDGHAGRVYEVTGPESLTFAEAVERISAAINRGISYTPVTVEECAAGMRQAGLPEEVVALLSELFGTVLDGRNSDVMPGVQDALGRPPRSFSDYVRTAATTGIWGN
ncbi:MAG: NmrA family NAD(P)-binding protein [Sphingobium sp.]|uniref:NmrA family NAD(P)-binding protein n=1 Tax=Sphingobium sp. TaxID=1912891 RepID=UPI003BAF5021